MRRQHDIRELEQGMAGRRRLFREDIDTGCGDLAMSERIDEGRLDHEAGARDVYQDRRRLHPRKSVVADEVPRFVGQRTVQRDDVRRRQQLVEVGVDEALCLGVAVTRAAVIDDPAIEASEQTADCPADIAEADEADLLAHQARGGAVELFLRPIASAYAFVRKHDPPQGCQHQRHGQFGDIDGRRAGGDGDRHAALPRRVEIYSVDPDAPPLDQLEPGGAGDHRRRDR